MGLIDKIKELYQMMVRTYKITRMMILERIDNLEKSSKNVSKSNT
jgi:hypothetical protein